MRILALLIAALAFLVLLDGGTAGIWMLILAAILFVGGSINATIRHESRRRSVRSRR